MNRGFADLRLNHLATPPVRLHSQFTIGNSPLTIVNGELSIVNGQSRVGVERETGLEPATPTLARWCSTTELLPLFSVSNINNGGFACKFFFLQSSGDSSIIIE